MAAARDKGKDVYVQWRVSTNQWVVRKFGNTLATALTDSRKQAIDIGRHAARQERSTLFIYDEKGKLKTTENPRRREKK